MKDFKYRRFAENDQSIDGSNSQRRQSKQYKKTTKIRNLPPIKVKTDYVQQLFRMTHL